MSLSVQPTSFGDIDYVTSNMTDTLTTLFHEPYHVLWTNYPKMDKYGQHLSYPVWTDYRVYPTLTLDYGQIL